MRGHTGISRLRAGVATIAAALLTACGGPTEVAGIEGSGFAGSASVSGPITGFGSVFVNGVEYATSAAQITIDGQPATESQLHAGQLVTIEGTVDSNGTTGAATTLTLIGDVQGPVSQIDLAGNTLTVLGQTVHVTPSTVVDPNIRPADLTGFSSGMVVEVSGFADPAGGIVASSVDLKPSGSGFQVKGVVQGLDATAHSFQLNGLLVDYSGTTPVPALTNGETIVAQGSILKDAGTLEAAHVEVVPGIAASANKYADLDGIITSFTSNTDFMLLGQHVTTGANTVFVLHGLSLAAGVEVDVKGKFDASGILQAQKVQARPFSSSLAAGLVDSVNMSAHTLSMMGVTVVLSDATTFEDLSSQHLRTFRLSDLNPGDYVFVSGTESTSGTLDAATLERVNSLSGSTLQGRASNVAQPNFTVLGVTVTTTAQTVYAGPGGAATGATNFFTQASNQLVRVIGTYSGGVFMAARVQIVQ